jgi:hypothetical protein
VAALRHIYARLHVSSRTAAVTRAFPDQQPYDAVGGTLAAEMSVLAEGPQQ